MRKYSVYILSISDIESLVNFLNQAVNKIQFSSILKTEDYSLTLRYLVSLIIILIVLLMYLLTYLF